MTKLNFGRFSGRLKKFWPFMLRKTYFRKVEVLNKTYIANVKSFNEKLEEIHLAANRTISRLAKVEIERPQESPYNRDVYQIGVQFDSRLLMGVNWKEEREFISGHLAMEVKNKIMQLQFSEPRRPY